MLHTVGDGLEGIKLDDEGIHGILYADDAVFLTETPGHMDLMVNSSKTKMMCVNSGPKRQFVYQDEKIEIIEELKYLWFVVSRGGKLDHGVNERAEGVTLHTLLPSSMQVLGTRNIVLQKRNKISYTSLYTPNLTCIKHDGLNK